MGAGLDEPISHVRGIVPSIGGFCTLQRRMSGGGKSKMGESFPYTGANAARGGEICGHGQGDFGGSRNGFSHDLLYGRDAARRNRGMRV